MKRSTDLQVCCIGGTKVLHYIKEECGVSLMKRSTDLQVCCIGRTKVLHYIKEECGVSLMKRSTDLQVCCIGRTKVLHYIKEGVACRRMTTKQSSLRQHTIFLDNFVFKMLIVLELFDFSLSCNKDGQDGDKGAIHCLPFLKFPAAG